MTQFLVNIDDSDLPGGGRSCTCEDIDSLLRGDLDFAFAREKKIHVTLVEQPTMVQFDANGAVLTIHEDCTTTVGFTPTGTTIEVRAASKLGVRL